MADKPLKSITFPGLADKYMIPEIDSTLTQQGEAADAKKTGDEISGVKNTLNQLDQNMAYVETGNTASRTYAAGDFISWKGILHKARTAIPATTAFAVGTNLAAVTDVDGNLCGGFNALKKSIDCKVTTGEFSITINTSANGALYVDSQDRNVLLTPPSSTSTLIGAVAIPTGYPGEVFFGRTLCGGNSLTRLYIYSTVQLSNFNVSCRYFAFWS